MKRGQSGINAAVLVAIIAVVIVIYILFLPSDTREDLLEENNTGPLYDDTGGDVELIFEDTIGRLEYISKRNNEHAINSFNLYTKTESEIIKEMNSLSVRNGWFDTKNAEFNFTISDVENTDNLFLSFTAKESKGKLIVKLNGYEIFNKDIDTVNVDPIILSKEYLAARNELQFSVSGVGIAFWDTNEYELEDIKIIGEVTDLSARDSTNIFIVSEAEANNIEESTLKFVPECEPRLAGKLEVSINGDVVYSAVPDCGTLVKRRLNPNIIIQGDNEVTFRSDRGDYLIDRVSIDTSLKDSPYYINYFDIEDEDIDDIKDDQKVLNITLEFMDDFEDKEGEIYINGAKMPFGRFRDEEYSRVINPDYIDSGSNSIKIVPKVTMDISKVKILLVDD